MAAKQGKGTGRKANRQRAEQTGTDAVLERLEVLIGELSGLRYEEDQERFDDIVAELVNFGERLQARLMAMVKSISYQERRAAVEAIGRLPFAERTQILLESLKDANWKVRRSAALAVSQQPVPEALEPLMELVEDAHRELRLAAIEALGRLKMLEAASVLETALGDNDWRIRQESSIALGRIGSPSSFGPLMGRLTDDDEDVQQASADALKGLLGRVERAAVRERLGLLDDKERRELLQALQKDALREPLGILLAELEHMVSVQVDVGEISQFGRVLTSSDQVRFLDRAFERDQEVDNLLNILRKDGNSSVILVGDAGVGKTAIIHEMTRRLIEEDPTCAVLETSTPELMVGTKYIGEWETKLHDLVEKIKQPRRVYLYLTNVNDLPGAGTTSSNKQNFVTLLAPYMRRGDITVIGESTAEALRTGIEKDLSIKRLFQNISVTEPDTVTVHQVVRQALRDQGRRHDAHFEAAPEVLELLIDLSGTYYSTMAQPGRSVTVLKQVVDHVLEQRGKEGESTQTLRIDAEDVIKGLARFTGLPELLLNDALPMDPVKVRQFFDERVLGQPEAVSSVVDLITLIKAGLTDPTKPFGVFLFVGPTGVGKTELAKVLAEFIFGSRDRMLRLDLSEYREYDSFEKLIGGTWRHKEEGRLTGKVREQPFSVILLDEVEKAHPNVFDLFLQVFDDGRLTDGQGRTADFRHTIIIMTSNLASAFKAGGPVGFGGEEGDSLASQAGIVREVKRFFRPEFLNRLDKVVVFRPLEPETMRQIAQRELGKVLTRSGLLRRKLVVDIKSSILDFLMAQGFSKAFGARPLKRAVESRVLLPIARAIVSSGPGYGGDVLEVAAPKGTDVSVERASSEFETRRRALMNAGQDALNGTNLEPLAAAPRTRKQAATQFKDASARLDALLQAHPRQQLRSHIEAVEEAMIKVTFWDKPQEAQQALLGKARRQSILEMLERLVGYQQMLQESLDNKLRLRDWHDRFVAWLIDLHLAEALVEAMAHTTGESP